METWKGSMTVRVCVCVLPLCGGRLAQVECHCPPLGQGKACVDVGWTKSLVFQWKITGLFLKDHSGVLGFFKNVFYIFLDMLGIYIWKSTFTGLKCAHSHLILWNSDNVKQILQIYLHYGATETAFFFFRSVGVCVQSFIVMLSKIQSLY